MPNFTHNGSIKNESEETVQSKHINKFYLDLLDIRWIGGIYAIVQKCAHAEEDTGREFESFEKV